MNVIAAVGTSERPHIGEPMERGKVQALPARVPHAEPDFHDVVQAGVIVRETNEKVTNRKLGRFALAHAPTDRISSYVRQGDNSLTFCRRSAMSYEGGRGRQKVNCPLR